MLLHKPLRYSLPAFSCCLVLSLASSAHAQYIAPSEVKDRVEEAKRHVPTSKQGIEAQTENLANLSAKEARLVLMRQRAAHINKQYTEYIQGVESGKIDPHQEFKNALPQMREGTAQLAAEYRVFLETKDTDLKQKLSHSLTKAIQPIGKFLKTANYADADFTLSKEGVAELKRIQALNKTVSTAKQSKKDLTLETPDHQYALINLPVPVVVKGEPNTTVIMNAASGGEFANGLSLCEYTTDAQGYVRTYWISRGNAVGESFVHVSSPQSMARHIVRINVVQLAIDNPLEELASRKAPAQLNTTVAPTLPSLPQQ